LEGSDPLLRQLIVSQFQGKYKYITACSSCNKRSESPCEFYELELSIKGHSTIEECLAQYVKEEHLTGPNQYMCSNCGKKQDAKRSISLCEFPEVLNVQLLRFEYDMQTGKKKKLKTNIKSPKVLDMKPFITEQVSDIPTYELSGILIHKGISAYGGHYVAHLRDEIANQWWIYDDTVVKQVQNDNLEQTLQQDEQTLLDETPTKSKKKKKKESNPNYIGSCNSYMLIYTKSKRNIVAKAQASEELQTIIKSESDTFFLPFLQQYLDK